jgi:hypothetical protein
MVVFGFVDFPPDTIDRITRRLAEQVKPFSPAYDDDTGKFDAIGGKFLASTILSHLIRTGDYHIKSEDSISAGALGRSRVSVSVEEENAD